jgi:peptidyl-prolyl cis-trans isomerase C
MVGTRCGFDLVAIDKRIPGETLPFEMVKERVAQRLKTSPEARALPQYVSILAG